MILVARGGGNSGNIRGKVVFRSGGVGRSWLGKKLKIYALTKKFFRHGRWRRTFRKMSKRFKRRSAKTDWSAIHRPIRLGRESVVIRWNRARRAREFIAWLSLCLGTMLGKRLNRSYPPQTRVWVRTVLLSRLIKRMEIDNFVNNSSKLIFLDRQTRGRLGLLSKLIKLPYGDSRRQRGSAQTQQVLHKGCLAGGLSTLRLGVYKRYFGRGQLHNMYRFKYGIFNRRVSKQLIRKKFFVNRKSISKQLTYYYHFAFLRKLLLKLKSCIFGMTKVIKFSRILPKVLKYSKYVSPETYQKKRYVRNLSNKFYLVALGQHNPFTVAQRLGIRRAVDVSTTKKFRQWYKLWLVLRQRWRVLAFEHGFAKTGARLFVRLGAKNAFVTLATLSGQVLFNVTAGQLDFKGKHRVSPYALEKLSNLVYMRTVEAGIRQVDLVVKVPMVFKIKRLLNQFLRPFEQSVPIQVRRIIYCPLIAHNGLRKPGKRRL